MVGLAQKLDWLKIDTFRNYHIKFKKVKMGYLEPDEQKCWDIRLKITHIYTRIVDSKISEEMNQVKSKLA